MQNISNVIAESKCIRQIHQKICVTKGFITSRMKGSHSFDINNVYFLRFWKILFFGIGKNAIKIRLGTSPFALGMPPFPGDADSTEKPLPAVHDRGRSLPLSPAEEPSQRQFIGQNAVTQILTVLKTMRDENREMKRMLQRLLARSATDDEPMQLPENISLPIGTFEQMDEFEEHLGDEATIHLF
ncbi:uncharacterized protein LOC127867179 [Dreissena polymorpha]|nr:uncharacterized protein LOC127867179 [Dreissena polymorpha]